MNITEKKTNERFFNRVMSMGSMYVWPDLNETFRIRNGKMVGSKRGVKEMRKITPKSFHSKLEIG